MEYTEQLRKFLETANAGDQKFFSEKNHGMKVGTVRTMISAWRVNKAKTDERNFFTRTKPSSNGTVLTIYCEEL